MGKYTIKGDDLQFLEVELDPGDSIISEPGTLIFMEDGIEMNSTLSNGSESTSLLGSLLNAGKRALAGENLFLLEYKNKSLVSKVVAIGSPFPGKIIPISLLRNETVLAQKGSFLCSERGIDISVAFTKKIHAGLFGGEGFILQKISKVTQLFLHSSGAIIEKNLAPGEILRVETGNVVAFTEGVDFDIELVNFKNQLFGGTGLFISTLKGSGKVWIQSHQTPKLIDHISSQIKKQPKD